MGHLPKQIHTALVAVCHYLKTSKVNFTFIQHKESQGKEEKYLFVGTVRIPWAKTKMVTDQVKFQLLIPHFTHCSNTIKIYLHVYISPVELALSEWDMDVPIGHGLTW